MKKRVLWSKAVVSVLFLWKQLAMSGDNFFLIKKIFKFILFFGHTTQHVKPLFLKQESNSHPLAVEECFPIHWTAWKVPGDNFGY